MSHCCCGSVPVPQSCRKELGHSRRRRNVTVTASKLPKGAKTLPATPKHHSGCEQSCWKKLRHFRRRRYVTAALRVTLFRPNGARMLVQSPTCRHNVGVCVRPPTPARSTLIPPPSSTNSHPSPKGTHLSAGRPDSRINVSGTPPGLSHQRVKYAAWTPPPRRRASADASFGDAHPQPRRRAKANASSRGVRASTLIPRPWLANSHSHPPRRY